MKRKKSIANITDSPITIRALNGTEIIFEPFIATDIEYETQEEFEHYRNLTQSHNFVNANWTPNFAEERRKIMKNWNDEYLVAFYYHWKDMQETKPLLTDKLGLVLQYGEYHYSKEVLIERMFTRVFKKEISSLKKRAHLIEKYIETCDKFQTTNPTLSQLNEISGISKSELSKSLNDAIFLAALLEESEKKTNLSKSTKEFWIGVSQCIDAKLQKRKYKAQRSHEEPKGDLQMY